MNRDPIFWEDPERVEEFATREPDHRLKELVNEYVDPAAVRVLDLGCAGGRNTEFLLRLGFDVIAVDSSTAMVERTRERLRQIVDEEEARRRVRIEAMDDLSGFEDSGFDLLIALGIYHAARSRAEWDRTLSESARVVAPGGKLLVSVFSPECDLTGEGVTPVPGEPHLFDGFPAGRSFLVDADTLDTELRGHGFAPLVETATVRPVVEVGRRVSVNGFYVKRMG
jgi:SAM-dependent methyltransferase